MQDNVKRKSNAARSQAMRAALLSAARALFAQKGYAATSTPEIVAAAGVTRGALYHHFRDKEALFEAVVIAEAQAVATDINQLAANAQSAMAALIAGGEAYLEAMALPGRTRLLLIDGPAALGPEKIAAIDRDHAASSLSAGLNMAMDQGAIVPMPVDALTALLSAMFDRAAIDISAGGDAKAYRQAMTAILNGLAAKAKPTP